MTTPSDPKASVEKGCKTNDISTVAQGLQATRATDPGIDIPALLSSALSTAIDAGHVAVVRYLLEKEHASAKGLNPLTVARNASIELLQLLVDHDFDLNKPAIRVPGPGRGGYLLQRLCHDEALVRWCVERGAKVDGMVVEPYTNPPLLQSVASLGTVEIFKYLREKGAKIEGRILHVAVGNVGSNTQSPDRLEKRMGMIKYLVDEVGLDVNELDSEEPMGNYWGTPICYAAHNPHDCAEVVSFLLERGADPYIKEAMDGTYDAFSYAKDANNTEILKMLEEWKSKHKAEKV